MFTTLMRDSYKRLTAGIVFLVFMPDMPRQDSHLYTYNEVESAMGANFKTESTSAIITISHPSH